MPTSADATQAPQPPQARRHGFLQTFGIDVRAVALVLLVDNMVFAGTWASGLMLYPVEILAGLILGFITYRIQRHWYGDAHDSALIKALIVGLLTAIPVPLTSSIPLGSAGFLGLLNLFLPKKHS